FAELRKFGISLVMVSQSLSEIPEGIVRNTGVKVVHRVDSPSDLRVLKPSSSERNLVDKVSTLMPGECVLILPYGLEVLQVRPVDELPLRRDRIDEIIRSSDFYWNSTHFEISSNMERKS
ncbi:MAG: hypothetical protein NZ992_03585, partial [Candidatus Korarchaeum sp.]|nr:hypothetical protein [Candidatus Korarchaeum sp.]MDW8035612.1 hypothetical protein [Candidatus Korarchaeum sp.]